MNLKLIALLFIKAFADYNADRIKTILTSSVPGGVMVLAPVDDCKSISS